MKTKWNVMDTCIVVVLIAVLGAGVWFLKGRTGNQSGARPAEVQVVVELTNRDREYGELVKVGDPVTIGEKEKMEATVTGVKINPAKTLGYDILNGAVKNSELPEKVDVQVTMKGVGTETDSAVMINNSPLRVGEGAAMNSKNWVGYGFIIGLDVLD